MGKFNLYEYLFLEQDEQEDPQIGVSDPNSQDPTQEISPENMPPATTQQQPATPPEPMAKQNKAKMPQNRSSFKDVLGKTISDIAFQPTGPGSGKIDITTSDSHNPLEISWVGDKVSVEKPDGSQIMLSGGEEK